MSMFNKDSDYFELFETGIGYSLHAAKVLRDSFPDGIPDESKIRSIKQIEHEGDKHVHKCLNIIEDAFITPIDRNDILEIVKGIEDITDSIDEISNTVYTLNIRRMEASYLKMIDLLVSACEYLSEMMAGLKQFKKNFKRIDDMNIEVNRIEEEGDHLYMEEMHRLFSDDCKLDVLDIIRRKELLYRLENSLDRCEDVADAVERIIIAKT